MEVVAKKHGFFFRMMKMLKTGCGDSGTTLRMY